MDPEGQNEVQGKQKIRIVVRQFLATLGVMPGIVTGIRCSLIFICILVTLASVFGLSVASIVIGVTHLEKDNCPSEENMAIILITTGVLGIVATLASGCRHMAPSDGDKAFLAVISGSLYLVKFCLFIYLCVMVFTLRPHVKYTPYRPDLNMPNYYCHPTLFQFTFVIIIIKFVVFGCLFLCCLCASCAE